MSPFDVGVAQLFQSTLSMRRATLPVGGFGEIGANFNPRSP